MIELYLLLSLYTIIASFVMCNLIRSLTGLFTWPPSIPTDYRTKKKILEIITKHNKGKSLEIADLGSGFGQLILSTAKVCPQHKLTGYEILGLPYIISKIKLILRKYKNVNIHYQDFLESNLTKFDIIMCFLCGSITSKLSSKLREEAKTGCLILSNNFTIPELTPVEVIKIKDLFATRKLYIYKT